MKRFERSALRTAVGVEWAGFLLAGAEGPSMNGSRAVVFALLCCFALVSGVAVHAQTGGESTMSVTGDNGTAEYLAPPPSAVDRSESATATLDVAGAVGDNAIELQTTYQRVNFQRAYRNAESDTERRMVLRNAATWYSERTDRLERRQRTAIRQYGDGEIGSQELFRTLAAVDRGAAAMESNVGWFENNADDLGMSGVRTQLNTDRVRLLTLQSPLGSTLESAFEGKRTLTVHTEVSDNATVLATVETDTNGGQTYLREAHDPSARSIGVPDTYDGDLSPALDRIETLYPWVTDNGSPTVDFLGPDRARLYRFEYDHPHGTLRTYLDGGSEDIVTEIQRNDPEAVPTDTVETVDGDLLLRVNTTRAGGPLGVTVLNETSGEPVAAAVGVNGREVGNTDGGRVWTVGPRGTVTVNATHDGRSLSITTTLQ